MRSKFSMISATVHPHLDLNKKEEEIYRALKQGGKNQHMATPAVKAVIDKVTGTMTLPMALATLAKPVISTITKH